ncbi:MAG TPA: phage tail protein, partial [Cyanobacteria bacterium UBA8553]|nr:phage tail protein [Cyanobacteria bacterium UBA8553]
MARLDYFAPGVYIEEIDRGSRPIEGVQTNIAGFIGFTEDVRGEAEQFKPMLVTSWSQYLEYFAKQDSDGYTDFNAYLPFAVSGWFLNGGGRCWVTSIGTQLPGTEPPPVEETGIKIKTSGNRPALHFTMKPEEVEYGRIDIAIRPSEPMPPPEDSEEEDPPFNTGEFFSVVISRNGQELERYDNLTMNREPQAQVATYAVTALEQSQFVTVTDLCQTGLPLVRRPVNGRFEVNPPPVVTRPERLARDVQGIRDDRTGVQGLFEIDEITMIACPDLMRAYEAGLMDMDQVHGIMELMVSLCENSAPNPPNRMVVLDPPPDRVKPQQVVQWLNDINRRSMFAALYYPWIKVANPRNGGRPILVPPCGHMLGVWSRIDETRGVYKAPANEIPRG